MIGIVSTVGNNGAALTHMTLKAVTGLGDTCLLQAGQPVARRQVQMDRAALTITHQMQFGIQARPWSADGSPLAVVFFLHHWRQSGGF